MQTAAQFGPLESDRAEVFAEGEQPEREVVFALEQVGDFLIATADGLVSNLPLVEPRGESEWWRGFYLWRGAVVVAGAAR